MESDFQEYLADVALKLKEKKQFNRNVHFTILETREYGFIVKVYSIKAYISYNYMPWSYQSSAIWQTVAPYLIGKQFEGKIFELDTDNKPFNIILNATDWNFPRPIYQISDCLEGIIVAKSKYGLFIDIGYHHDWKYGSQVGLYHNSNFEDQLTINTYEVGDTLEVFFHGNNDKRQPIIGSKNMNENRNNENELKKYVHSIQNIKVYKNEKGETEYKLFKKYPVRLPITKSVYPVNKGFIKKTLKHLEHGDSVVATIIKYKNGYLHAKILL